jgi:3-oxoacyl-[acyl-carrier protein] reductase
MNQEIRYAIVTGGSRGIGREIGLRLASELGYHILINYQSNRKAAEETRELILQQGGQASLLPYDVQDRKAAAQAIQEWKEAHPSAKIEVIVNNAGITRDGLFMWMSPEDWDQVLDTSLQGFYNTTQLLIQDLLRQRYGRIINIASVSGAKGTAGQVNYSAAKAGLIGASKALAQEVAKRNITVNVVAPGFIETDMTEALDQDQLKKLIPLQRFGKASEVADLVCFLASPKAGYITGEVVHINGGIYS